VLSIFLCVNIIFIVRCQFLLLAIFVKGRKVIEETGILIQYSTVDLQVFVSVGLDVRFYLVSL